jgi:hypothetical protein
MAGQAVLLGLQGTLGHPALELFDGLAANGELDEMKRHGSVAGWRRQALTLTLLSESLLSESIVFIV